MLDASVVTVVVDADTGDDVGRPKSWPLGHQGRSGDPGSGADFGIELPDWYSAWPVAHSCAVRSVFARVLGLPVAVVRVPIGAVGAAGSFQRIGLSAVPARIFEGSAGHSVDGDAFGIVLLGGSAAVVYAMGKAEGLPGALGGSGDCFSVHPVFLAAATRLLHEPGPGARGHGRISSISSWSPAGLFVIYKKALISPFVRVSADGDRGTGHRLFPAHAGE